MLMHVRYTSQRLVHNCCHFGFIELLVSPGAVLHFVEQVAIGILEDNVNFVFLFVVDHFFEFDQEDALVQLLQRHDLRHVEALVPGGVLPLHFLNCNKLLIILVDALYDSTVGTFTQLFYKLILLH